MNWGWRDNYPTQNLDNYDLWFTPTEDWVVNWRNESGSITTEAYTDKTVMIYDFDILK